jgi:lipopolysaccharide transport system permease protein
MQGSFRCCILGQKSAVYWSGLVTFVKIAALLVGTGIWYFRRTERRFADVI